MSQSSRLVSVPSQLSLSRNIGPEPGPNLLLLCGTAPVIYDSKCECGPCSAHSHG